MEKLKGEKNVGRGKNGLGVERERERERERATKRVLYQCQLHSTAIKHSMHLLILAKEKDQQLV